MKEQGFKNKCIDYEGVYNTLFRIVGSIGLLILYDRIR